MSGALRTVGLLCRAALFVAFVVACLVSIGAGAVLVAWAVQVAPWGRP